MQIGRGWLSAQLASCSATKVVLANDMMRWPRGQDVPELVDDQDGPGGDNDDGDDGHGDDGVKLSLITVRV